MIALLAIGIIGVMVGFVAGVAGTCVACLVSAGSTEAGEDKYMWREVLLQYLDSSKVDEIEDRTLPLWGQWRKRMRPLLWRIGWDWKEYRQQTKEDFFRIYGAGLPEAGTELVDPGPVSDQSPQPDYQDA